MLKTTADPYQGHSCWKSPATRINSARDSGSFPDYVYFLSPFDELPAYIGDKKSSMMYLDFLLKLVNQNWFTLPIKLIQAYGGTLP